MKKRILTVLASIILIFNIQARSTTAYIVSSSAPVDNTFTVGKVNITLTETTGSEYLLVPGVTLEKDPKITVLADSEDCWLFVKVEETSGFRDFCSYEMEQGWIAYSGVEGLYYMNVEVPEADVRVKVLKNDSVLVKDSVTEMDLRTLVEYPTLSFVAYAVQSEGVLTANKAWDILNQ